jgi:hypothetical protein
MSRTTLFLSGACGSGKTAAMRVMRRHALPVFGETAVLDVDHVYTMVDPDYSIPFPEAERYWSLARRQCAVLAASYVENGFNLVVIGGNSVYQKDRLNEVLDGLLPVSQVYHITLDPSLEVIQARIRARAHPSDDLKTPDWIESHVRYMRGQYEEWSARIDNSALTPSETALAICDTVLSGKGRLACRFPL